MKDDTLRNPRTGVLVRFLQQKVQEMSAIFDLDHVCFFDASNENLVITYDSFMIMEQYIFLDLWYAYAYREIKILMLPERISLMYPLMLLNRESLRLFLLFTKTKISVCWYFIFEALCWYQHYVSFYFYSQYQ